MDFTRITYKKLLSVLKQSGYSFLSFDDFLKASIINEKIIILRHDVDAKPENSRLFAIIENELGIRGSYYFRIVPQSWDEKIIKEIASLGHEIGYHYEDVDIVAKKRSNSTTDEKVLSKAKESFECNLYKLRSLAKVNTICMHGSPRSKYDNRILWKYYDYHDYDIYGEPYFDVDFSKIAYYTDTGRCWDGDKFSVRDKVGSPFLGSFPRYHSTNNIIDAIKKGSFPKQLMLTLHPQRWEDKLFPWLKELILQNVKNTIKFFVVKVRNKS